MSLSASVVVLGVTFLLVIQTFSSTINEELVDVGEAYKEMADRALEQCQTSINITEIVDAGWWDTDWSYRKMIIINHSQVTEDLVDFPVLIYRGADPDLAAEAQNSGYDIMFISDDNTTKYNHEIESYNATTGELTAWVNIPRLSANVDTVVYMYYGNAGCDDQQNISGTWDENYKMVHHLNETAGTLYDSTSYDNDGTNSGASYNASSKIDGGYDFNDSGTINCGNDNSLDITNTLTLEAWVKDPPVGPLNKKKSQVAIVDKRDEQRVITPDEQFTVQRTIKTDIPTSVVFVCLCSPGIEITNMQSMGQSLIGGSYLSDDDDAAIANIEQVKKTLPHELQQLQHVVYSKPFTINAERAPIMVSCYANNMKNYNDGQISYLVIAADGCYDFEGTTHWVYNLGLIDWLNPFSVAKAVVDFFFGSSQQEKDKGEEKYFIKETTHYNSVVNQPVQWRTNLRFTNKDIQEKTFVRQISIPSYATNITINDARGNILDAILRVNDTNTTYDSYLLTVNASVKSGETKTIFVRYTTPEPHINEMKISPFEKQVVVSSDIHYTDVKAYAAIDNRSKGAIHLYHIVNGSRQKTSFTAIDLDNDTLIDRIEWTVPHLSEQTYEVVIEITKAKHLDKNRRFLADIYDDVKAKDGNWSELIYNDEYVQVSFSEPLDKTNDITIFARSQGIADIEVYTKDNDSIIATFTHISDEKWYKILLSELSGTHTTFDLRTKGDPVQYDYLVDPVADTSVDSINPYIQSSVPLATTATNITPANNVTLYYRYSADNISWDKSLTQDFNVQRGTCVIPTGATTVTITNGSHYTLVTDENHAFIRIANTRLTGMGPTSGGYSDNVEGGDYATRIDNPDNLGTSITFRRAIADATYDCRVTWELVQYVGPSDGRNEFLVRDVGDVTTASGQSIDGDSNITTIEDIDKVCCFITGQAADETTDADWFEFLFVADMRDNGGGGYTPWFWRAKSSATDAYVSYAVVEFVGSNWRDVQRLNISTKATTAWTTASPNEYTDVTIQSEGGSDLLDASKAFLHVQYATDNDATGLDDAGDNIEIVSTTSLRIRNKATTGNRYKVVWIIENKYNGTGEMEVEHIQFYDSTTSGAEERSWTQSITAVDNMSNASIIGECASVDGTGNAYPRGSIDIRLTDIDEVTLTECDNGQERQITFDVVQWPCSINWNFYANDTNPDENSPWSWDFTFPNGTGYYEFYSIGKISGEYDEIAPAVADARCYYNPAPTQQNEGPANGSTKIDIIPVLNVTVDDVDGETLTAFWISNSSGSWEQFAVNNSIDTSGGAIGIKQTNSNFSDWETTYWWSVNITDGVSWSNITYQFTTNFVSSINNPIPANQSSDLNITPICNITVSDVDGGSANISFYENTTGSWKLQQTNSSVDVTAPANVIWNYYNNATSYGTTYWWKVNATDDKGAYIEVIYHFTTSYPPVLSNPDPENGTLSEPVSTVCSITVSDNDGGNVTVRFYENKTGAWKLQQTNSSVNVSTPAIVIWDSYSNASAFNTKYWWKVNVTDSKGLSSEETYQFTTALGNPPVQSAENPPDFSTNIPITLTTINVTIGEIDGESLNWTIQTKPDIGDNSGSNEGNGSKTCSVSGLTHGTTYTWYVNVTDGTDWTNETYTFTTSFQPDIDNPGPTNGSKEQNLTPRCNITVSDVDGGTVNISFYENTTGVWKVQQTNESVDVTSPANIVWLTYTNATQRKNTYWWKVNATDNDGNSREKIYHFTTTKGAPPQIALVSPAPNGTTNVPILSSCRIWANDSEGDTLTVYWYENSSGSYQLRTTYNNNVSANSTTGYVFSQFTNYSRTYYWKVVVNDSYYNTTATYTFTTEPIDTSVNRISPYNITWSPLTTMASGGADLTNLTLYYRWSEDNASWGGGPPQWTTLYYDDFEDGTYGNYSEEDTDGDVTINAAGWIDGTYSVYLRDNTGANLYLTDAIEAKTDNYAQTRVDFSFVVDDFNNPGTEDWWFQYYNSSSSAWETVYDYDCGVGTYIDQNSGTDWDTNGIIRQTFYFNESEGWNLSDDFRIRFYCDASGDADDLYIDSIYINATTGPIQGTNWAVWENVSNPDDVSPWRWDFNFPNSTGYYEFYTIGKKQGSGDESAPASADAMCFFKLGGHKPTIDLINPSPNGTTGVNVLPLCQVWINDTDGDTLDVYWYENTTGSWVMRNKNASISTNTLVNYSFSQFANYAVTYWWKVAVNDTLNNVSALFSFTTEPLDTSVDTISPYNVNNKPLTIIATNVTPVDNITLWYRYSTVNQSWATYETGIVEDVNGWTGVTLDNTYANPVVIVTGQEGADRSLGVEKSRPRVRNVGATSFEVIVTNDTGITVTEDVGYIVMEEGHWDIDGVEVEAGTYTVSDAGSHVIAFSESFPGNTVVVDTIQEDTTVDASSRYVEGSMNATDYTVYWQGYDDNSNLATVTAGYIAVEVGSSSSIFESGIADEVTDDPDSGTWRSVSFSNSYSATPILFTNPIDEGGGDPTIVGRRSLNTAGVDVRCTEGQNQDDEMDHATNDIPWMVWTEATASGTNWIEWNGTNNPDTVSPWSWDFPFPNGTGYYEFYTIGKKVDSGDEPVPSIADAGCQYLNTAPIATNESPANESFNVSRNSILSIQVNDSEGHSMNITWYWGIDSNCSNFIGTNTSISNGTYFMGNENNFSELGQTYYWKVAIVDSFSAWTNETYHFKTTGVNKEIISKEKTAYALEISPDGTILYGIVNNTNVTTPIDTSWHYVVLAYNGSTLSLYIDGELCNTTALTGSIPINEQDVLLGGRLTGTLDEIRISDTARNDAWIETSHAMMSEPTTFMRIESEQNQNFTYLNITIENRGSNTLKTEEFSLLVNGTELPFVGLQPYLYPNQEMRVFVHVVAAGSKRNTFITGDGISNCKGFG